MRSLKILSLGLLLTLGLTQMLRGDLLTVDDFSVPTGLLTVNGGGEDSEATADYGGPLNGLSTRGLLLSSFASDASAQIAGGQMSFSPSDSDSTARVVYEFNIGLPLASLGDGLFVEVASNSADFELGMFIASLDVNDDPVFAFAGTTILTPGVFEFNFSQFIDELPGSPVDRSQIRGIGFDLGGLSDSPSSISINQFGFTTIPEPTSCWLIPTVAFAWAMRRRRSV